MTATCLPTSLAWPETAMVRTRLVSGRGRTLPRSVYRRRRLAALLLSSVTVLGVRAAVIDVTGHGVPPASATSASRRIALRTYRVQPGDTLWQVARRLQPSGDVRPLVDRLAAVTHGGALRPGEVLVVP